MQIPERQNFLIFAIPMGSFHAIVDSDPTIIAKIWRFRQGRVDCTKNPSAGGVRIKNGMSQCEQYLQSAYIYMYPNNGTFAYKPN